jgi:glycosyltransferase involved in cell wall biosynthesis
MQSTPAVSIIICTRNRFTDLRNTLDSLAAVRVPNDLPCELLIVDNGSTDATRQVVQSSHLPSLQVRYLYEPQPGQSRARNLGLAEARGKVIVFTDDDVRPPPDWICRMTAPILSASGQAVAGGVRIAAHLHRDWMSTMHRSWLASTEYIKRGAPDKLVGANMAFSRSVLQNVPGFDVRLGPGALGYGDDTFFAFQLLAQGLRIVDALDVVVEHRFDPSRLLRPNWLRMAKNMGRTRAYIAYHWEKCDISGEWKQLLLTKFRLAAWRIRHHQDTLPREGLPDWELKMQQDVGFWQQICREKGRPRRYSDRVLGSACNKRAGESETL